MEAANTSPQTTIRPIAGQNASIRPISASDIVLATAIAISAEVRRSKRRRIHGAAISAVAVPALALSRRQNAPADTVELTEAPPAPQPA